MLCEYQISNLDRHENVLSSIEIYIPSGIEIIQHPPNIDFDPFFGCSVISILYEKS